MKTATRPQYHRLQRILELIRVGTRAGSLPNCGHFTRELAVSRRTLMRDMGLCDFASAGNAWSETNLDRTWLPQPLFLRQAFVTNTWKLLEPGPLRPVIPAEALARKAAGQPSGQEKAPGERP